MRPGFVSLLILAGSAALAVGAEEKAPAKSSPVVAGGITRSIVYDPKAREKALAKAAEERPTDVIFLQEVVVLAPRDNRKVGQAISWQEEMMAASRFNNQTGGVLLKGSWLGLPGGIGLWNYNNVTAKDAAYSAKPPPPSVELFRLHP
jgi:hypothetical protein